MSGSVVSAALPLMGKTCLSYHGLTRNLSVIPASRNASRMSSQYPGTAFATLTPANAGGLTDSHAYGRYAISQSPFKETAS